MKMLDLTKWPWFIDSLMQCSQCWRMFHQFLSNIFNPLNIVTDFRVDSCKTQHEMAISPHFTSKQTIVNPSSPGRSLLAQPLSTPSWSQVWLSSAWWRIPPPLSPWQGSRPPGWWLAQRRPGPWLSHWAGLSTSRLTSWSRILPGLAL